MWHNCRYLQADVTRHRVYHRCHHPQVHAKRGVAAEICEVCEFCAPPPGIQGSPPQLDSFRTEPPPRETSWPFDPSAPRTHASCVSVTSQRDQGRVLLGRTEVNPGEHQVYTCDVVIPYFKGLRWLPAAIESILCQNYVRCNVHLINDDSPEDDRPIRRRFRRFKNLYWYRNRKNIGPFVAVNAVFDEFKTDFLVIQDADDVSLPTRLWRSIHALQITHCELYAAAMEQFIDSALGVAPVHARHLHQLPILHSGGPSRSSPRGHLVNGTMVCRRSTFESLNGFADLRCGADSEFIARAHLAGKKMFIDEVTVGMRRMHDHSLSRCSEFATDTPYGTLVNEYIADLERQAQAGGAAVDLQRFGALNDHRSQRLVVRLQAVAPTGLSPRPAVRLLADLDGQGHAFEYLSRQGFVGAEARLTAAVLPLHRFRDFTEFVKSLSRNVRRDVKLALKNRYVCREFVPENHAQDILAIAGSLQQRQGRAMRDTLSQTFLPNVQEPVAPKELAPIGNPYFFNRWFGIFMPQDQEHPPQKGERLLAFIGLCRNGEVASYARILGHGEYLRYGIMFALHAYVMQWLLDHRMGVTRGLRYLHYSAWEDGQDGLRLWKRRAGFRPYCFWERTRSDDLSIVREITVDSPLAPAGRGQGEGIGKTAVISHTMLTRPESDAFPAYVLDGSQSAAAFFCAAFGGQNDAAHLHRADIDDVALIDHDFDKLASMQGFFSDSWNYYVGDAFLIAGELVRERTYDVVSCDQWSTQFELVADRHFRTFYDLAKRYLLISVVPHCADGNNSNGASRKACDGRDDRFLAQIRDAFSTDEIPVHLSRCLSHRNGFPVSVVDVVRRSSYLGGCYWIVIEKEPRI